MIFSVQGNNNSIYSLLLHSKQLSAKALPSSTLSSFSLVVFATGSVVIDAKTHGVLGVRSIAFAPFIGVAIRVYFFGKISMAHFNPAVTVGYLITGHIRRIQLAYYFAEISSGSVGFSTLVHVIQFDDSAPVIYLLLLRILTSIRHNQPFSLICIRFLTF
jgi:hypothetical protein